jgi:hypothetical protein
LFERTLYFDQNLGVLQQILFHDLLDAALLGIGEHRGVGSHRANAQRAEEQEPG